MFPGLPKWAENDTFTGGPDVGSDTKDAPSSGQEGEGYYRQYRPSAQVWNYNNWAALGLARNAAATRSLNYLKTNSTGPDASTGGGSYVSPVYDPIARNWFFLLDNGAGTDADECVFSYRGYLVATTRNAWEVSNLTTPGANGRQPTDFAVDVVTGDRAYVAGVGADRAWYAASGGFAVGGTQYAAAFGTSGAAAQTWERLDHNGLSGANSRWVLSGRAAGATTFWYAQTTTSALAAVTVDPAFGANTVTEIVHTHHEANTNYYGDPGNSIWMAIGPVQYSTSSDGLTWTAASNHGLSFATGLGYSAYGSRWISTTLFGGAVTIVYSDDNGATWTAGQQLATGYAALKTTIRSDNAGHWVIAIADTTTPDQDVFVSVDNGITWVPPQLPDEYPLSITLSDISCGYGGGRFWFLSDDGAANPNFGLYSSLIGGDL